MYSILYGTIFCKYRQIKVKGRLILRVVRGLFEGGIITLRWVKYVQFIRGRRQIKGAD